MSTTFRADRAAEAIRAVIARALTQEVEDPRLQAVTITACQVSHDLQNAKLFYTVLGDDEARRLAQQGFDRAKPFLRGRVGQEVPLRAVPELMFRYDTATENAQRIEAILASLPELHTSDEP